MEEANKCDVRGDSLHVQYVLKGDDEMNDVEIRNITHNDVFPELDDYEDEIGFVVELKSDKPGFVQMHILSHDDQLSFHYLSLQSVEQLADMFTLAAMRIRSDKDADDEKKGNYILDSLR